MNSQNLAMRIEWVLRAACVGDALGAATEGMHPDEIRRVFGGEVRELREPPELAPFARGLTPGRLTDDATQLLVMARMLVRTAARPSAEDAVAGLIEWAGDAEMFRRFAGPTTRLAVERLRSGVPPLEVATPDGYSCMFGTSNGGAMRAPAAGCVAVGDPREAARLSCVLSAPTHNTQIAWQGSGAIAAAIAVGLSGAPAMSMIDAALLGAEIGDAQARRSGRIVGGAGVMRRIEIAARIGEQYLGDMDGAVAELTALVGNGVAMAEAVPHAFGLIVAAGGDPWEAIVAAVNGGNDSDTIAMIAGATASAWWRADSVPSDLSATVERVNDLALGRLSAELSSVGV